jgi:hypothetical protein
MLLYFEKVQKERQLAGLVAWLLEVSGDIPGIPKLVVNIRWQVKLSIIESGLPV